MLSSTQLPIILELQPHPPLPTTPNKHLSVFFHLLIINIFFVVRKRTKLQAKMICLHPSADRQMLRFPFFIHSLSIYELFHLSDGLF